MNETSDGDDETADEYSRRTALKTMGVAGAGLAGSVIATGDASAAGPTAVITADTLPAEYGESITFDGSASTGTIETYEWYIRNNDSNQDYLSSPSRTGESFTESFSDNPYSVKLEVTDADGNTDSAETDFVIENSLTPNARLKMVPPATSDGVRTFVGRDSTAPGSTIESYEWYIRNDDSSNGFSNYASGPSFALAFSDSQFTVKLEVTDADGSVGTDSVTFNR
jgi:hypothetical protein